MLRAKVCKAAIVIAFACAQFARLAGGAIAVSAVAGSPAGSVASAAPVSGTCLTLTQFRAPGVEVTSAEEIAAGPFQRNGPPGAPRAAVELPAHCLVAGIIERRIGVGGKPYGIRFELRLPFEWNQRFLFQGGGGINGAVFPAIGAVKGPAALTQAYAVVSQDAGHEGQDASFGEDQQARIDMEYRSYERVTAVAKQLIAAFYGHAAEHSYFMGCSEGGREALLVSQRLPLEYDGVIAGDPGFMLGVSFTANADRIAIAGISPNGTDGKPDYSKAFSDADLKLLETTIADECDAKDGLKDGLIDDPSGCHPQLEHLICKGSPKSGSCLSKSQVRVLRRIFEGGEPDGHQHVSPGYFYDTGVDLPMWKGKLAGVGGLKVNGVNSIQGLFLTPYDPGYDDTSIDFVKDGARFDEVGALNRADGVMYSSFKQHGGKLLIYTGLADSAFSAKELVAYYLRLARANGEAAATADFARLFLVPGMTHCGGGRSLDDFNPLQAIVAWVENDTAPDRLVATGKAFPGRSRPLCPYPKQSRYRGTGSIEEAENFQCRLPEPEKLEGRRVR